MDKNGNSICAGKDFRKLIRKIWNISVNSTMLPTDYLHHKGEVMGKKIIKILSILCILSVILGCAACKSSSGGINETDIDNGTQMLEVPTADVNIQDMTKEIADFKKIDNYWCREVVVANETWYQTAPVWMGERVDIYDIKDMFIDGMASESNIFTNIGNINKPDGAEASRIGYAGLGIQIYQWTKPDYTHKDDTDGLRAEYLTRAYTIGTRDNNLIISKSDVNCLNIALYEDWCDYRQKLTIKLYGVTEEQFDKYLKISEGDRGIRAHMDLRDIYDDHKSGKIPLAALAEKEITETGNYYVDYGDIQNGKEYKQILYVIETDCDPDKYAFCVTGLEYDINESAIDKYNQWKEKNKELFFGQK